MSHLSIILLLLTPLVSTAQTWPDSTCPDRPYTKGNDGIIYHTNDCSPKGRTIAFNDEDSTVVQEDYRGVITNVTRKKKPLNEKRDANGWRILQPNSLVYCPACNSMREYSHLLELESEGAIVRVKDSVFIQNPYFKEGFTSSDNRKLAHKYLQQKKHSQIP